MIEGANSLYHCLLIHICLKVDSEARMETPIHTEYLCSGGAIILDLHGAGCEGGDFLLHPSVIPGYTVPLDSTVLACTSLQMSTSHFITELKVDWVDATGFHAQEGRLEQSLRTPKPRCR